MATVCLAGISNVTRSRIVTERLAAAKTIDTSFTVIIKPTLPFETGAQGCYYTVQKSVMEHGFT
jgi:hypothetical protein